MSLQRLMGNPLIQIAASDVTPLKRKALGALVERSSGSTSLSAILATVIPTGVTGILFIAIFVVIRNQYRNIYAPRTYMGVIPEKNRTPSSGLGRYDWLHDFWVLDNKFVLTHQSLDGYLFLRFFKLVITICFVGCCITWPILFPVNATGGGRARQLDRISFSNIDKNGHLYAHAIVAWVFLAAVMLIVTHEQLFLIGLRHAYLFSTANAARLSSRTVLFLSVPDEALHKDRLHQTFGDEAKKSWVVTDLQELETLVEDCNNTAKELEAAEVFWQRRLNQERLQQPQKTSSRADTTSRPRHRVTPIIGTKVDSIYWSRNKVSQKINDIRNARGPESEEPRNGSAVFVEFTSQGAAQQAYFRTSHQYLPPQMAPRYIGIQPKEVLWKNLTISAPALVTRLSLATAFVIASILFWSIPIGFIGAISNVSYLAGKVRFLRFLNNLPDSVVGLISGLLPPLVISTFVSYVPVIFRYIAKLAGEPTIPQAELRTQTWYLWFQVIQVFLVTTFSSGAAAVAAKIAQDPSLVAPLLAEYLPKASNFYLTYFILQGLTTAPKNVLNYTDLLTHIVFYNFFDKTPRAKYDRYTSLKGISWGAVYPKFTNMAIIAISYSCIAPLVLGFATVGLWLFYQSYRYNLLYVIQTKVDTKGECYARALQHLLIGVYLSELCLLGLFGTRKASGPFALLIILLCATTIYHILMNRLFRHLEETASMQEEDEETPLLAAAEEAAATPEDQDILRIRQVMKPETLLAPIARYFHAHFSATWKTHKRLLQESAEDEGPSSDQLDTAYLNPALTSKTPKLWLVKDEMGISKKEIEANEAVGITTTDEGATLDSENNIRWSQDDLSEVPIFKKPVLY